MATTPYTDAAGAFSKKAIWLVEIDLDRCSLDYTVGACTASDAGDGSRCFYSYKTCQDVANYAKTTKTYRFCSNTVPWPDDATAVFPLIEKVRSIPHKVSTSTFFGFPEKIRVDMFRDYSPPTPDSDKTLFNTAIVGEFWRNLFSRNKNYSGRALRIKRGFSTSGFTLADFSQVGPEYLISAIEFDKGMCTITAKSPLAKLRERKVPFAISEDNVLTAGVNDSVVTFPVTDGSEFPIPGDYTRNNVYIEVDSEICLLSSISTNDLTVVRGSFGTSAATHSLDAKVKHVACFGTTAGLAVNSIDAIQDLMEWADVAAADVDTTKFDAVKAGHWPEDDVVRTLRSSKTVARLMQEIKEVRGVLVYLDSAAKWSCDVIGPRVADASYDDDSMRSVEVIEDDKERRTRVALWYGPTKDDATETEDFSKAVIVIDTDLETANNYGDVRERQILDLWLDPASRVAYVRNLAQKIITRSASGERRFVFELEIKDGLRYIGDAINVTTRELTDIYGMNVTAPCVIVARREKGDGAMQFVAVDTNFSGSFFRWGPDTMGATYDTATDDDKQYGYWGDTNNRVGTTKIEGYIFF